MHGRDTFPFMTGLCGGITTGKSLRRLADSTPDRPWYESDRVEAGSLGLAGTHHGDRDSDGFAVWDDGMTAGMIHGAVTNLDDLGWRYPDLFERFLRSPEQTLRTIDGQFLIAAIDGDADRIVLGTDKIGCRQCYYATRDGLVFATGLDPMVTALDEPQADHQGVSDMVLMGHAWSDRTLLEGVQSLYPATVLEYRAGEVTTARYWQPSFSPAAPTDQYFYELVDTFRGAIDRLSTTLSGSVGLWLSGGLDSRATMNELARTQRDGAFESVIAYTYDANPAGGGNPALAGRVAEALEAPFEEVPLTPDRFTQILEDGVDAVDGMIRWNTFLNLSAVHNIDRPADVIMEGLEGALVGHHPRRDYVSGQPSLVQSMYASEASVSAETVDRIVEPDVDPLESYRAEARRRTVDTLEEAVIEAHFQNYYMRAAHASNQLTRRRVGTRIPYADGDLLSHVARLPLAYRMASVPFTGGAVPYGVVEPKVRMIRALNTDLSQIPYERSGIKPTWPFPLHVLGFLGSTAAARLRSKTTYGGRTMPGEWYRTHDGLRETVNAALDDACSRALFNADAIRDLQQAHLSGEADEINPLAAVSTVELWLQRHLD